MTSGECVHSPSGEWANGSGGHVAVNGSNMMVFTDEMLEGDVQFSERAHEGFVLKDWIDRYGLGNAVAGNFFMVHSDFLTKFIYLFV